MVGQTCQPRGAATRSYFRLRVGVLTNHNGVAHYGSSWKSCTQWFVGFRKPIFERYVDFYFWKSVWQSKNAVFEKCTNSTMTDIKCTVYDHLKKRKICLSIRWIMPKMIMIQGRPYTTQNMVQPVYYSPVHTQQKSWKSSIIVILIL